MNKILTALALALAITQGLIAQKNERPAEYRKARSERSERDQRSASVRGRITSSDGALEYATVYLHGTNIHTATNARGEYHLPIPAGKHSLRVQYVGMASHSEEISVRGGERLIRDIRLSADGSQVLREQVVVGRREGRRERDLGFAVQLVETQALASQSIQTSEILERAAGVKVRQDGGLGSRTNFNINGFSGNAVRIFIDGTPADNYGSAFSLQSIPPSLIERIEVFKGVVPGHLASDALGGAINVILKDQRRTSLQTSYSLGSFNTHQWNMTGSLRSSKGFALEGSAFYNYSDNDYEVWGKDIELKDYLGRVRPATERMRRFHDAYSSYGARASVGLVRQSWADKFMLTGIFSDTYKEMQHGTTMRNVYGDRHSRGDSRILELTYHKKGLLPRFDLALDASYSWIGRQIIDTVGIMYSWAGPILNASGQPLRYTKGAEVASQPTLARDDDKTLMLRAMLTYHFTKTSHLHLGYLFNDFRRSVSDPLEDPRLVQLADTRDLAKGVLTATYERIDLDGKLRSSLFYKHYHQHATSHEPYLSSGEVLTNSFSKDVNFSGYGITLSYSLTPRLQLLGSAERALRMPSPNELFGNSSANLLPPATELEPERSTNVNLGAIYTLDLGAHRLGLNGTLLYRDTRGMIRQAIMGGSFDYSRYENLENVLSYGIDTELTYSYDHRLEARISLSKLQALFNTEYDQLGDRYQYYRMHIRNEPSFKVNGTLSYTQPNLFARGGRGTIHTSINYVEAFHRDWSNVGSNNLAIIPTLLTTDLGLSYSFPKHRLTLSLDAKNIFDRQVYDNYGLQKPGRSLFAKVSYRIF